MEPQKRVEQEAAFVRMAQSKTRRRPDPARLGESMVRFYKGAVQRTRKFAGIAHVWETLVPQELLEHSCLESYRAGTLTILVDSSPHLYRLKQLLLEGLQKQVLELCRPNGLRKIALRPGRWYVGDGDQDRTITFND